MFSNKSFGAVFKMRTMLYFCIPAVLMIIIILVNHSLNEKNYCKIYQDFYFDYFDRIFQNNDEELQSIVRMSYWLENDSFVKVFEASETPSDIDAMKAISRMNRLRRENSYIDSMLIVNKKANCVIATNGKADIDKYFTDMYVYKDYSVDFLMRMRNPVESVVKLPPTSIETNDGGKKYVMPIVLISVEGVSSNNLFIINIDISKILGQNQNNRFTPNTSIYFVNKQTRRMYSTDGNELEMNFKSNIWDKIVAGDYVRENYTNDKGNKYLVLSHTASPNLMDYAYVILVPVKDIYDIVGGNTLKIVFVTVIMLLVFSLAILLIANRFNMPLAKIISMLNMENVSNVNVLFHMTDKIESRINYMSSENKKLKNDMSKAMHEIKEKRISDAVNERGKGNNELNKRLFNYENFLAVIIRIETYEQALTDANYDIFCDKIYGTIENYFSEKYDAYVIATAEKELHMIMNISDDITEEMINKEIDDLEQIICEASLKVRLIRYMGGICSEEEGLKNTYRSAREKAKQFVLDIPVKMQISSENKFIYRLSDNNAIANNILSNNYEKALNHIDKVIIENILNNITEYNMKILYMNIIHTIITGFKMKSIDIDSLFGGKNENEIYNDVLKMSEEQIVEFILKMLDTINNLSEDNVDSKLTDDVLKYIENNYKDFSLSLNSVAEQFGTNAKYISKLIKKNRNILFHDYLSGLRIGEAKRLLETSDMSIESIYEAVGYTSRSTFIRAFKTIEGVTPTVYRSNKKKYQ